MQRSAVSLETAWNPGCTRETSVLLLFKNSLNSEMKIIEIHVRIVVCDQIQRSSKRLGEGKSKWLENYNCREQQICFFLQKSYSDAKSAY